MPRKVAIVTGASSGIGAAAAVALAKSKCNVLITYGRNKDGGAETAKACKDHRVDATFVQADISNDEDCRAVAQTALNQWGRIDVLINNAGTTRFADANDLDALQGDDFARIFAVNVTGGYQMTRAAEALLRTSRGAIVNVSSHSGFSGIGSSIAYAASKGALNTLTLSLARTLAPDVRVNAVCPGFVDTDWMATKLDTEALNAFKEKTASITPLKRIPTADDIADAIVWFALGTVPVTGQLLVIDGGTHLTVGDPL